MKYIKKGYHPWNKGTKGIMKINSGSFKKGEHKNIKTEFKKGKSASPETQFKKGSIPWNKYSHIKPNHNKGFQKMEKNLNFIEGRSKLLSPARYGDDWDKIRYLVYLRDRFTCQNCGIKGVRLDIHHKIPFLQSFNNSLSNLITLCRPCHMKIEAGIRKELNSGRLNT